MSDWKKRATPANPDDWKGDAATAADWEAQETAKPALLLAEKRFADNEQRLSAPAPADSDPDVSGLNPKPAEPPGLLERALRAIINPKTALGAGTQKFAQGASVGLSDEAQGLMAGVDEAGHAMRQKVGLEDKPEALADPVDGSAPPEASILKRVLDSYRSERDAQRGNQAAASQEHPVISGLAETAGALTVPVPKLAPMAKGATALQRMGKMGLSALPVGAAFGLGNSNADLTQGDVGGAVRDTATGAGTAALTSAILGGLLHKPLSKLEGKERDAIAKAEAMAQESFDKPQAAAQGALGGAVQKAHRRIENGEKYLADPDIDPLVARDNADFISSPEGIALRNRIAKANAKDLPGLLSEVEGKQAEFDALKAANTPENVAAKKDEILSPERFKDATMMRLKKYAGRAIIPTVASGIGGYIGGPTGAAVGGLLGGVGSAVMGNPGTALANYMRDPAVAMRLAQLGQEPATSQAIPAAVSSLTSDEDKRRRLEEKIRSLLGQ